MTADRQYLKVTWGFGIVGTDEVADTSINYSGGTILYNATAALAEVDLPGGSGVELFNVMGDLMTPGDIRWASYSKLRSVKVAAIDAAGHYLTDAKVWESPIPLSGPSTGIAPQETIVLSLRSGATLGGGNYGRMYLPHSAFPLGVESPFAVAGATAGIATAAKTFVNGVTTILNTELTVNVVPMIITQKTGALSKPVVQIAIGNVIDTQRRRRNRLPETYSFETL